MQTKTQSKRTYRPRGLLYLTIIGVGLILVSPFFGKSVAKEPVQATFIGEVGNSKVYQFWNSPYSCIIVESQITYNTSISCN